MDARRTFLRKALTSGTVVWSGLRLPTVVQDRKPRKSVTLRTKAVVVKELP